MIVALNDFRFGHSELTEEVEDEIDRLAALLIPEFARNLNAWTGTRNFGNRGRGVVRPHVRSERGEPAAFGHNVGCSEPFPCGTCRKHKHCCGTHRPKFGNHKGAPNDLMPFITVEGVARHRHSDASPALSSADNSSSREK